MTEREFEEREQQLYENMRLIVERATDISLYERNHIDIAYRDDTRMGRYHKHLKSVSYGVYDLWKSIEELRDVISKLEIEYDQQPKEGDKHERT